MATKKSEAYIEFGARTENFKKGIKEMNAELKNASNELRLNATQLKGAGDNVDLLSERQNLLQKELQASNQKVELTEKSLAECKATLGENSKEYQNLTQEVLKAKNQQAAIQNELDQTTEKLKKVKDENKEAASAFGKLADEIDQQESELSKLKSKYSDVVIAQGKTSREAKDLAKEIEDLSSELKDNKKKMSDAEDAANEFDNTLDDVGDSAEDTSNKLETLKSVAGKIGGAVASVGAAAAGAVGGFLSLAEETRETRTQMSKLDAAFAETYVTADEAKAAYKDLYGVLGDEGQALEAVSFFGQLARNEEELAEWTTICTGVYGTFGDALPVEGLAEAANETAKCGQVTGGLADALNWTTMSSFGWEEALGSNSKALEAFNKATAEGLTQEEAFNAALAECSTEQERATLITDTLGTMYSDTAAEFEYYNKDVIDANKAQAELNETMAELGAVAEPILTTLKQLANDVLQSIKPFVSLVGEGLTGALNGADGAAEKFAEGLGGIVSSLLDKVVEMLPFAVETIGTLLSQIVETAVEVLPQVIKTIVDQLPTILQTVIDIVIEVINALSECLPDIIAAIVEIIPVLIEQLIAAIPQLLEAAVTLLMAIVDALPEIITSLIDALPSLIDAIIEMLITSIPVLMDGAIQLFNAIVEAIPVIIISLLERLPDIIQSIITGLLDAIPLLLEAAINLLHAIIEAVPMIITELIPVLPEIITTIIEVLISSIPQILEAGGQILFGLIEGLFGALPDLLSGLGEIMKAFLDAFLEFFGIHSPSKVMEEQGGFISEGLISGIKELPEKAKEIFTKIKDNIVNKISDAKKKAVDLFNNIKTSIQEKITQAKDKVVSIFNTIKQKIIEPITSAKQKASEIFNNIKSSITDKIESLKNSVAKKFSDLKTKMLSPIEKARDLIKGIVDKIVGFFKVKIEFPKPKLPHFSITPKGWKVSDLLEGSIPKLGIEWYAKGGFFNKPTVLSGLGEAGPEYALPLNERSLMPLATMLNKLTMQGENGLAEVLTSRFDMAVDRLAARLENLESNFYLDGEHFASATGGYNDRASGTRLQLTERGLTLK